MTYLFDKRKKINVVFFFNLIFICFNSSSTDIFFDMGGVLLKTSKFKAFTRLGMDAMAHTNLKDRFFEFVNHVDKAQLNDSPAVFNGVTLPPSFCKWQKGQMTCSELVDFIIDEADKNPSFFRSKTEQKLIKKSAKLLLPANNVDVTKSIRDMVKLVKECKNKRDASGNLVNNIYLTSNCDEETFAAFKDAFPETFELFDEDKIIISGKIKMIKPNTDFFEYAIKKFDCKAENCLLIDDQLANIEGAKKSNIDGIWHKTPSKTRKILKQMNVI